MSEEGYTIKEVVDLTRQEQTAGFTKLETMLGTKADKADLIPIHERLDKHEGHIRTLQDAVLVDVTDAADASKRANNWRWAVGVGSGVVGILGATILAHFIH